MEIGTPSIVSLFCFEGLGRRVGHQDFLHLP